MRQFPLTLMAHNKAHATFEGFSKWTFRTSDTGSYPISKSIISVIENCLDLIGSCQQGYFLQIVLTSESGKLTILEVKKANDDEISEDWCNSLL